MVYATHQTWNLGCREKKRKKLTRAKTTSGSNASEYSLEDYNNIKMKSTPSRNGIEVSGDTEYKRFQARKSWRETFTAIYPFQYHSNITKLFVANIDSEISAEHLILLFSQHGAINLEYYNRSDIKRDTGTACVIFEQKTNALSAFAAYNLAPLMGRMMHLTLVTLEEEALDEKENRSRVERKRYRIGNIHWRRRHRSR